jgi:predicted DNA-binding transcriptional regulator YafY
MLELLQAHHRLTGAELAVRLGVDERTVRRYAGTLADLGIPVTAARGRYGGYRLSPGYKLPPLMLTDDEAVAVVLGLVAAERLGLGTEAPATAAALSKINRVLPAALVDRLSAVQQTLGFTLDRRDAAARPATAILLSLGAATRAHRRVSLTYRSWRSTGRDPTGTGRDPAAGGGPAVTGRDPTPTGRDPTAAGRDPAASASARDVDPYGLVFHAGRWYLAGHDHRSGEIRTFRLDRIGTVDVRDATFDPPPDFDAVGHVARSLADVPYTWQVEVLLETDLDQARRRIPAFVAGLSVSADGVLLRARAQSLPGMAQMLAGLGWSFTVLRPDELRGAVAEHAARLAACAQRTP